MEGVYAEWDLGGGGGGGVQAQCKNTEAVLCAAPLVCSTCRLQPLAPLLLLQHE